MSQSITPYLPNRMKGHFAIGNIKRLSFYDRIGLFAIFVKVTGEWKQIMGRAYIEFNGVWLN
jgi:hypothetical protein